MNSLRGLGLVKQDSKRKVKVYDACKKELIQEFDSLSDASLFTGVASFHISKLIRTKHKSHVNNLNKVLAFR